jgi:hypothetical protein
MILKLQKVHKPIFTCLVGSWYRIARRKKELNRFLIAASVLKKYFQKNVL